MDLLRQQNGVFDVRLMPDDAAILALALKQAGDGGNAHLYRYIAAVEAMQATFELCALVGYQVWGNLPKEAGPEAVRAGPAALVLALLNSAVLALTDRLAVPNLPAQMRRFMADPASALALLLKNPDF